MRALAGLLVLVALLTACGAPFGDGTLPALSGAPVAANTNAATATRGTASATSSAPVRTSTSVLATATRGATSTAVTPISIATTTPTVAAPTPTRTATPVPVRPGPPVVTPGVVATPGTPGAASPVAGTPGTPRAATPIAGATPGTPTAAANDQNRTTTQIFAPYRPDGLVKSLRATGTISGYCVGGSQSLPGRPDAWRCASGGQILDPCFASSTPDTQPLACAVAPWSDEITLLNLTAPLPRDRANGAFSIVANPWGFQLANGARCQSLTTGGTTVAGMAVTASCSDGSQLLGDPDRSGGRWRVFVMRDNNASLESQEIVAVWY